MKERIDFIRCLDWIVAEDKQFAHFEQLARDTKLQLIQVGRHQTGADYSYGPMIRDHYLIHFIRSGCGMMTDMVKEYSLHENQCFLICPDRMSLYRASHNSPWKYYWVGFRGEWGQSILDEMHLDAEHPIANLSDPDALFALLDRMVDSISPSRKYLTMTGQLFELLDILRDSRGTNEGAQHATQMAHGNSSQLVQNIKVMIENSYGERLHVSEIAANMGYSRSYLTEVFHRETGIPISRYITDFRLERAQLIMRNPSYSVQQVAYLCGYSDPLFFSRIFKKRFGMSPRAFRESWNQNEISLE